MNAEHERLKEILAEATAKASATERAAYLDDACRGDPALRARVESMLAAHDRAGGFLEEPVIAASQRTEVDSVPPTHKPGDRIGHYKLLEQIGEGGCGVVYLAEQEAPVRRRVALKVIKLGMDTKAVIARFEAERQALALMDHPNIAKVFDAGATDTGRPFFVMELLRGIKITEYCDQHNVPVSERLDLFIQVCHAIQHAHQKGIIHRDIKPSNILVMMADDKPVPKVIDFGIAKATAQQPLTDKTFYTAFEQFIGTPAYMSPEQAGMSGLDVDTRSDIYSLGVLLYELLTGSTPFDTKELLESGLDHMRQIIREREPVPPSTRLTQLRFTTSSPIANQKSRIENDLDWIVMKCLQKDRTRRYETANGLAADLDHHLNHEPVVARPPSTTYRVQKFVRRNKVIVTAAAAVALALVLGIITSTWQRNIAREAQAKEAKQRQRAEAGKLLALGQTQLEDDPTAALAYARASLELADTPEARRFAVKVLWSGPIARILHVERMARELQLPEDSSPINWIELSPNGRWLATPSRSNRRILIFPWDGGAPQVVPRQPEADLPRPPCSHNTWASEFGPRSHLLITGGPGSSMRFWSFPELKEVRTIELGGISSWGNVRGDKLLTCTQMDEEGTNLLLRAWPLPEGKPEVLGNFTPPEKDRWDVAPSGTMIAYGREGTVCVRSLGHSRLVAERVLGSAGDEVRDVTFSPRGDRLASLHESGEIRIWSMIGEAADPLRILRGPKYQFSLLLFEPEGRLLTQLGPNNAILLWDLEGPPDSAPVVVGRPGPGALILGAFHPEGKWLATSYGIDTIEFWPLKTPRVRAVGGITSTVWSIAFTSDSRWLAVCPLGLPASLWSVSAADGAARDLLPEEPCISLATNPGRSDVLVGTTKGNVYLCPTEGGPPRLLPGGWPERTGRAAMATPVSFDPTGRWAIATPYSGGRGFSDPKDRVVRIWDVESEQERVYSLAHLTDDDWDGAFFLGFGTDGRLYGSLGKAGDIMRLTLPAESDGEILSETIVSAASSRSVLSPDGRLLLVMASSNTQTHNFTFERLLLFDLLERTSRQITTHGVRQSVAAQFDTSGRVIVTGDVEGVVRVGPVSGEEPHLLLGHKGMITSVALSPDGRWIASATEESIRLWPMPDVTKPPLHTLPHDELLAKLEAFTNLRAVRDETSSTGWSLEVGPFPGWETVPEW